MVVVIIGVVEQSPVRVGVDKGLDLREVGVPQLKPNSTTEEGGKDRVMDARYRRNNGRGGKVL